MFRKEYIGGFQVERWTDRLCRKARDISSSIAEFFRRFRV